MKSRYEVHTRSSRKPSHIFSADCTWNSKKGQKICRLVLSLLHATCRSTSSTPQQWTLLQGTKSVLFLWRLSLLFIMWRQIYKFEFRSNSMSLNLCWWLKGSKQYIEIQTSAHESGNHITCSSPCKRSAVSVSRSWCNLIDRLHKWHIWGMRSFFFLLFLLFFPRFSIRLLSWISREDRNLWWFQSCGAALLISQLYKASIHQKGTDRTSRIFELTPARWLVNPCPSCFRLQVSILEPGKPDSDALH